MAWTRAVIRGRTRVANAAPALTVIPGRIHSGTREVPGGASRAVVPGRPCGVMPGSTPAKIPVVAGVRSLGSARVPIPGPGETLGLIRAGTRAAAGGVFPARMTAVIPAWEDEASQGRARAVAPASVIPEMAP